MDLEQIEAILLEALKLRSPHFPGPRQETSARTKIAALEEYMLKSAYVNGSLVEARHWCREAEAALGESWEALQGWEIYLKRPRAKATKAEINLAKIEAAPQLYAAARKARRLRESVVDQIVRLEREERVMSRTYTMIAGS